MSDIDSDQFREDRRQSWDSVASRWQKWRRTFDKGAQKISDRLIELAEIQPGSKVVDIATGIGEPAITAAMREGICGHVLATDISLQMLSIAKQRTISQNLQGIIDFKEDDVETIDLAASTFDAALCRWGLMFLPNIESGLSNIYGSLVDGGVLQSLFGLHQTRFHNFLWLSILQERKLIFQHLLPLEPQGHIV